MATKPILFNTQMVRAILDGQKTQTRRVVKPQPIPIEREDEAEEGDVIMWLGELHRLRSPRNNRRYAGELEAIPIHPYRPGDILYVRETWNINNMNPEKHQIGVLYKADKAFSWCDISEEDYEKYDTSIAESNYDAWRPSIHMPKEAARIFLRVTDMRVERLQEIDGAGIKAEGTSSKHGFGATRGAFIGLWDSTIKPADLDRYGWAANPWVWVIEFERCEKPEEMGGNDE